MSDLSWLTAQPIAHRGFHDMNRQRWENTLAAFEAAVDHGYAIECDVHLAADGVPVVFHDETLERLTGREGRVWQLSSTELAALRIGGTSQTVPTLAQVLERIGGRVPLVIELKGVAGHDSGLAEKVLACLAAYEGKVALMSFAHWIIRELGANAGGWPIGLTAEGRSAADMEAHFSMLAHGLSFASYNVDDLPNPFVSFLRERLSLPVITWTVRNREAMERTFRYADQMTFEGFSP
ncbi:glycerophosphodiester phosphodiesterase [Chelativorans intermedius]|uniref:Glycerophosphodiester phosphodiesterase n=1 Tax=Chelativorans intermedius TaxID=515947 RepID=A0ABV6D2U1_9HYPH|nr:glycerophosphodiester phosphodiesterase [Chelativorans intermedius]MCT8998541.1 glycerophosphodiester phosphodiesterase [Chelativorans intermedius]